LSQYITNVESGDTYTNIRDPRVCALMLNFFLIKKTQVIAQNCGAWKLVAMALNKAQGFGYPFKKDGKHILKSPQNKTPTKSTPQKKKSINKNYLFRIYIWSEK
jgi:hypothetical protein